MFHITIQTERRTLFQDEVVQELVSNPCDENGEPLGEPKEILITKRVPIRQGAIAVSEQLHSFSSATLPENLSDPQFVMVAEWDGSAPYVLQHKGDYASRNMGYAGWPEITKEQWVSQQADLMGVS